MAIRSKLKAPKFYIYICLVILTIIFLVPIYMTFMTALKEPSEIYLPKA